MERRISHIQSTIFKHKFLKNEIPQKISLLIFKRKYRVTENLYLDNLATPAITSTDHNIFQHTFY